MVVRLTSPAMSAPTSRVLLVEDDADVGWWVQQTIARAGYDVTAAQTMAEARSLLRSGSYALVLTDWKLPDGSGILIAREAKAAGAATLVLTGYALLLPPAALEGHDCLRKPLSAEELLSAVHHQIGPAPPHGSGGAPAG